MPKLSVVIPVYNVEKYLRECLDSVCAQTLGDMEIICVDDGSRDSSPDILREYARRDQRIKVISKPNSGYGHTMNTGFDAASGDYLGIVESDDVVPPEMFERLCRAADENRCDIVKSDFFTFVEQDGERVFKRRELAETVKNPKRFYGRVLKPLYEPEVFRLTMNTWCGVYRTQFIRENNIRHNETPGASFQDNGLWFQSMALAERVLFIGEAYYMLRRDNAASSVHDRTKVWALNKEYDFIYGFLREHEELFTPLVGYYWLKRYHNFAWSYDERVGAEFREELVCAAAEDLRRAKKNGELDISLFERREAARLERIIADPKTFHREELPWLALRDETASGGGGSGLERLGKRLRLSLHDRGAVGTAGLAVRKAIGRLTGKQ